MKYLITGGCGFLGSNLAMALLKRGQEVVVLDNLYRMGSNQNLEWLRSGTAVVFENIDIRDATGVEKLVARHKPDVIFHLAGQVAMTTSIENPRLDFEVNALGTFNVLEAVRKHSSETALVYSSTNKVYGDLEYVAYVEKEKRYIAPDYPHGFDENTRLDFHSPYGCSKGAADQYVLDYARIFGLNTAVFRHSSIYGGRQYATYEQGWVGWFAKQAVDFKNGKGKEFTVSGNGKQVRDVLHAEDAVSCYISAAKKIKSTRGQAYNIGGGMKNSLSILELFDMLESKLSVRLKWKSIPWRKSDQKVFVADVRKAEKDFGWKPCVSREDGIDKMITWAGEISG